MLSGPGVFLLTLVEVVCVEGFRKGGLSGRVAGAKRRLTHSALAKKTNYRLAKLAE